MIRLLTRLAIAVVLCFSLPICAFADGFETGFISEGTTNQQSEDNIENNDPPTKEQTEVTNSSFENDVQNGNESDVSSQIDNEFETDVIDDSGNTIIVPKEPAQDSTTPTSNDANPTSPSSSSESSSSSQEESSIFYSDIESNKWYASDVAKATELGLINGYDGKFYPNNNLTYSEAIKLAACMHQLKTTGKITLINGTKNWYDTYVEYAKQNKIISKDYDWTANATRAGYVEIFAHALPDEALSAKNAIADGAIPDVAMSDYAASEVYKLYRAGILTGSDAKGTFNPDSNILRCEVAAILTRMMDESARKTISLS